MGTHHLFTIAIVSAIFVHLWLGIECGKILRLPGQPNVSFQQFSGYITVERKPERALFYYFVEAESDAASKPLVLWLNGGPGCSSVGAGALVEHGPFRPNGEALVKNQYSWNNEANMLYLESPAGVGFSYSVDPAFYTKISDTLTARDNLRFLQLWFDEFPQYKGREFYITGESYAGHYVPQLAQLIIQSKTNTIINLKGVAIGNPLLEFVTDMNSADEFYWSHGLISDSAFELVTQKCNSSRLMREIVALSPSEECIAVFNLVSEEISGLVDRYDVISDVCLSAKHSTKGMLDHPIWSKFHLMAFLHSKSPPQVPIQMQEVDVCGQDHTNKYLNRRDVQESLHARLVGIKRWNLCNRAVQYRQNLQDPTINIVGFIVKSGVPVMVYSGDQDSVVPFTGTRLLVYRLAKALRLNSTVQYRAWIEGGQVGGWTQVYGDKLSYATIRGASHTAPASQPERSLALFKSVLAGKPLPFV